MHAFIVRPFGRKNGIDFDQIEEELIRPALVEAGFSGGTTVEFIQQGNIRKDMFGQLLIADFVIADISIHNANVFYELGIRHAFRDKHTFLINSEAAEVPFDLKTDKYLPYNAHNPAASLDKLTRAIQKTWESQEKDSPVFQLLTDLKATDPSRFNLVPLDFCEEVEWAVKAGDSARLQLLAAEIDGFSWKSSGLRSIGKSQFQLKDFQGSRETWENVRSYDAKDLEANTLLGTIYQRLGDLTRSTQALERALQNKDLAREHRAESWALMARNAKTKWDQSWQDEGDIDSRQQAALISRYLENSYILYNKGFIEDRNHFYSGLNALAMLTIIIELATAHPNTWNSLFDDNDTAECELKRLQKERPELATGVKLAISSKLKEQENPDQADIWAQISGADLLFLTSANPQRVVTAYKKVLAGAEGFVFDSVRKQIQLFEKLGVLQNNSQAVLQYLPEMKAEKEEKAPPHVILFTGHMLDAAGRETPRFPAASEDLAREMITQAVKKIADEAKKSGKELIGISGGASGGDILFHEICKTMGIHNRLYLVIPKAQYIASSVAAAGDPWVIRFNDLYGKNETEILLTNGELPGWLKNKEHYTIWERSNLWMLYQALTISKEDLTLIALWNGEEGDGPGGTKDMVTRAQARGARFILLDANNLLT
ncbi:MAG: hypothetical protein GY799_07405 [Desulfobulbaceae bacterium]|nr:hypothetical protein [Desulfobulbaceae bacterium]